MTALLLQVFGGLAIFVYGMKLMGDGLHNVAGEKMRSILRLFSANRFVGMLSGTVVTAVVQSSSATTVMIIGFVNAGLLSLSQSIGIIFGANIGTTITAQLVAFDIGWIVMPSIIIGLVLTFVSRRPWGDWGYTILGLGLLFFGMGIMGDELKQLAGNESFRSLFSFFKCTPAESGFLPLPQLLGAVAVGLVATFVIQSSSACSGIVLALGTSGLLDLYTAVAVILGSNIGTTVTAQLAALTANRVAKQAALAHTLFNCIGVLIVLFSFLLVWNGEPAFFKLVKSFSANGGLSRQIANAHTIFNVLTTLALIAFVPLFAKVCEMLIPVREDKIRYSRLEPRFLDTPPIALAQTTDAVRKMLSKAWRMVNCAFKLYDQNDKANLQIAAKLDEREKEVDERQQQIADYLSQLMQHQMHSEHSAQVPVLLHCANDAERIGDHTFIIRRLIETLHEGDRKFSDVAESEFLSLQGKLGRQAQCALALLAGVTSEVKKEAAHLRDEIIELTVRFETQHLQRLREKRCSTDTGVIYLELLSEIRKVSRHLANISERAEQVYPAPRRAQIDS